MTAGIKRMLAERAALASGKPLPPQGRQHARLDRFFERKRAQVQRQWIERIEAERDRVFALVDKSAPQIDAVAFQGGLGWLPSTKLKLIYWTVRSGPNPDNSFHALNLIERLLDIARERHQEGLDPNPWLGPVEK